MQIKTRFGSSKWTTDLSKKDAKFIIGKRCRAFIQTLRSGRRLYLVQGEVFLQKGTAGSERKAKRAARRALEQCERL